jgi:transcriptional regulator with XRE-family HTH domain
MSKSKGRRELSYEARARMADNLFLLRRRAEYSQGELAERARVSAGQIGSIESGKVLGMLDTYVRLAGALSLTLDDLLAGVTWTPGEFEFEIDAGYKVEFEVEGAEASSGTLDS